MTEQGKNNKDNRNNSYVNIKEYANSKNVDVHIINGYISAHRDEFAGHIAKDKNAAALDNWARDQLDTYIENRPDKGKRFHRFEQKGEDMGVEMKVSHLSFDDGSPSLGDSELGIDVSDMREGADDMDAVSTAQPSMNRHKSRVTKIKHYSTPTKNDELENMKETEERLTEKPVAEVSRIKQRQANAFTFKEFADNYSELNKISVMIQNLDREIDSYDISLSDMQQERYELSQSPLVYPEDIERMQSETAERAEKKAEKLFERRSILTDRVEEIIHTKDDEKVNKIVNLDESILAGKIIGSFGKSTVLSELDVFENWKMVEKTQDREFRFSLVEKYNEHWLEDGSQEEAEEVFKGMDSVNEIQSLTERFENEVNITKVSALDEQKCEDIGEAFKSNSEAGVDLLDDPDFDALDELEIDE